MNPRLIVVSGTGTEIGKTHACEALLIRLGREGHRAAGVKPIETGLAEPGPSDSERLANASTFHVKPLPAWQRFPEPLGPHLVARRANVRIDVEEIARAARGIRDVDVLVVELAGGLFSPLGDSRTNADLALALRPDATVLVAPDRLGVLHEVLSTRLACKALGLALDPVVLMAPDRPDLSTGTNAAELLEVGATQKAVALPRAPAAELASHPEMQKLARWLLGEP